MGNRFTLLEAVILGHLKDMEQSLKALKALMVSMGRPPKVGPLK